MNPGGKGSGHAWLTTLADHWLIKEASKLPETWLYVGCLAQPLMDVWIPRGPQGRVESKASYRVKYHEKYKTTKCCLAFIPHPFDQTNFHEIFSKNKLIYFFMSSYDGHLNRVCASRYPWQREPFPATGIAPAIAWVANDDKFERAEKKNVSEWIFCYFLLNATCIWHIK